MCSFVPLVLLAALGAGSPGTAGAAPAAGVRPEAASSPLPPAPDFEAVGLVRSPAPGRSIAVLRCEGRTRVVAVGETAFGARLVSIGNETVTLDRAGRQLELRLVPLPASTPVPRVAPSAAPPPSDAPPEDPATPARDMDRRQVQLRLGEEMNRILAETAIAPVMENGRVVGVQVTRIADGSLLTDAGLRVGDVLTRVNGTDIDGMATLIGLWPRLQNASELNAVVLRGGQPMSLRVSLR